MTMRKEIALFLLTGFGLCVSWVQAAPQEEATIQIDQHSALEESITNQIKTLRMITLDILAILRDGRIPHSIDSEKLRDWVYQFDNILQQLQTTTPAMATTKAVVHCTKLLKTAFQEKFTKLPLYKKDYIETLLIAAPDEKHAEAILKEITKLAQSNEKELEKLTAQSRSFGHTIVNRCARNFESFIKHSPVAQVIKFALLGTLGWWLGKKLFEKNVTPTMQDGKIVGITENPSLFSQYARDVMIGASAAAATQFGERLVTNSRDMIVSGYSSLKRTGSYYWERLKGTPSILDGGYQHVEDNDSILSDKNIIGLTRQLEELRPLIQVAFNQQGYIRKNQHVQRSFLFQGPSGCGKTYLAFYLKKLIEHTFAQNGSQESVRFRVIQRQELSFKFLSEIIAEERNKGGVVILFLDEIHLLQPQDTQNPFILNEFLTEMTALHNSQDPHSQIFIIGATNSPEKLDVALTVAGRFKPINFDYPNATTRREFFEAHLADTGFQPTAAQLESYVRQTEGKSFADIRRIIETKQGSGELLTHEHLQAAIFADLYRFVNTLDDVTPAEKHTIAIHQASKAIAHVAFGCEEYLEWVTISGIQPKVQERNLLNFEATKANPNDPKPKVFGALICHNLNEALHTESQEAKIKRCKRLLAGICGQELITGTYSTTYHSNDLSCALALAQDIILRGKPLKDLSERRQNEIRDEAEKLLESYRKEVRTTLEKHQQALRTLMQKLEEKITVSGQDIQALVKQAPKAA